MYVRMYVRMPARKKYGNNRQIVRWQTTGTNKHEMLFVSLPLGPQRRGRWVCAMAVKQLDSLSSAIHFAIEAHDFYFSPRYILNATYVLFTKW